MITQNFNTGKLVTDQKNKKKQKKKKNTQRLLLLWKITLGQGLSLSYKKQKCQNCDKFNINHFWVKKGLPIFTANRLLRWGTILLNDNFKIEYTSRTQ